MNSFSLMFVGEKFAVNMNHFSWSNEKVRAVLFGIQFWTIIFNVTL